MITLRKGSVLYRWFLFVVEWTPGGDEYKHREQTNLCFFLRTLIIRAPLMVFTLIVASPIIAVFMGIEELWNWLKSQRRKPITIEYKSRQPSKIKVIYDTVHGKICPTVIFE